MPGHRVFNLNLEETTERLARQYGLSRSMAKMLALLVCQPIVTTTIMSNKIGCVDTYNLVSSLRHRLRDIDDGIIVRTLHGFGYCLDAATRLRLAEGAQEVAAKIEELRREA